MVVSDKEVNRKLYGLLPLSICHCPGFKEEGEYLWLSIEGEEKEEEEENGGVGGVELSIRTPTHGWQFNPMAFARKINHPCNA